MHLVTDKRRQVVSGVGGVFEEKRYSMREDKIRVIAPGDRLEEASRQWGGRCI